MIKKHEIAAKGSCLNRAEDDEMIFVLLGRDKAAPFAIQEWARQRILLGKNKTDDTQIKEAYECAEIMRDQQREKQDKERIKQGIIYDRVNKAIEVLKKKRVMHTMQCEFPEGCSCHAKYINQEIDSAISELNKIKAKA